MATFKSKIATRHHNRLQAITAQLKNLADDTLLDNTLRREDQLQLDAIVEELDKLNKAVVG